MQKIHLLQMTAMPIYEQLQLEEALLRADERNWCLFNEGSSPAIVMGISGKTPQLVNTPLVRQKPISIIRRFSGGGTVVVDENTLFATLIVNKTDVQIPCCPKKIMDWTGELYRSCLEGLDFHVKENDYALGDKKFGGNAQYMRSHRWLHHTSLLWDYEAENMNYLLFPRKTPLYRDKRSHHDFLCKLKEHVSDKKEIAQKLIAQLEKRFQVIPIALEEAMRVLQIPHRKMTCFVEE